MDGSEIHGQGGFGKFKRHAEYGGNPHPEERSRSAVIDGGSDPGNITDPYCSGQSCTQRLKVVDIAFVIRIVKLPSQHI